MLYYPGAIADCVEAYLIVLMGESIVVGLFGMGVGIVVIVVGQLLNWVYDSQK